MNLVNERILVTDMHCTACEPRIEKALHKLNGITKASANYAKGYVDVEYDADICNTAAIKETIQQTGYHIGEPKKEKIIGILIIFVAVFLLANITDSYDIDSQLKDNASYLMLFVIGLFTSLHCVGMCGGLMLSQSVTAAGKGKLAALYPTISYNVGRIVSYTLLGGVVGAIGSVISLSLSFKAGLTIAAGLFMIMMGLNMAGFTLFRKFQIQIPWTKYLPQTTGKTPFVVGFLNGLMPCGPLQTMQLYALGTGSVTKGAIAMFIFALGTTPLLLAFGSVTGFLNKDHTQRILKLSGVLVLSLGLIMANRGLAMSGINLPGTNLFAPKTAQGAAAVKAEISDGVQTLKITANGRGYVPNVLFVQKGIPVKWIIEGEALNSCNNEIIVPNLKIERKLSRGENIVEFTPANVGDISFSCWMGMIRGAIRVVDDLSSVDVAAATPVPSSSGCGMGCCAKRNSNNSANPAQIPTEQLIRKASLAGIGQSATIVVENSKLSPALTVIDQNQPARLTFEFNSMASSGEKYSIVDINSGETMLSFEIQKKSAEVTFEPKNPGIYGIVKNGSIIGGIEAAEDLSTVDLEKLREKYF